MPVMPILTSLEQDAYTQPPVFSHVERKRFCDFPLSLLAIADTLVLSQTGPGDEHEPVNQLDYAASE